MPTTAKKKPAKRPSTARKAPVKKTTATHKKPVAKTTSRTKKPELKSFRASANTEPFFTFRISHQTLYWLILAIIVVGLAVWVMVISARVQHIYDQIDATNAQTRALPDTPVHLKSTK